LEEEEEEEDEGKKRAALLCNYNFCFNSSSSPCEE